MADGHGRTVMGGDGAGTVNEPAWRARRAMPDRPRPPRGEPNGSFFMPTWSCTVGERGKGGAHHTQQGEKGGGECKRYAGTGEDACARPGTKTSLSSPPPLYPPPASTSHTSWPWAGAGSGSMPGMPVGAGAAPGAAATAAEAIAGSVPSASNVSSPPSLTLPGDMNDLSPRGVSNAWGSERRTKEVPIVRPRARRKLAGTYTHARCAGHGSATVPRHPPV